MIAQPASCTSAMKSDHFTAAMLGWIFGKGNRRRADFCIIKAKVRVRGRLRPILPPFLPPQFSLSRIWAMIADPPIRLPVYPLPLASLPSIHSIHSIFPQNGQFPLRHPEVEVHQQLLLLLRPLIGIGCGKMNTALRALRWQTDPGHVFSRLLSSSASASRSMAPSRTSSLGIETP